MRKKRRSNDQIFEESLFNNNEDYLNFENRLISMAVARFKIENLPREIYEPFIIRKLITTNKLVFFKDDIVNEYICYPFTTADGQIDKYTQPINRRVTLPNGTTYTDLTPKNSVIIRASNSGMPILPIIQQYARELYLINRTIDINVNAQKTPILLECDEDDRLSVMQLYQKYTGNQPVLIGSKDFNIGNRINVLNTGAPYVSDKLYDLFTNKWNSYLTFLGIPNVSIEKKERMTKDEVNRQLGGVIVQRNDICNSIARDLNEVNKMFGLDLKLVFGGDLIEYETKEESEEISTDGESEALTNE